ncbi:hypothetical protein BOV92_09430, partial [Solemya velum gill symbiont]
MKLKKTSDQILDNSAATSAEHTASKTGVQMNRRDFLKNSGIMAGGAALATSLTPGMMKKAEAAEAG